MMNTIAREIFRQYDIRGIVGRDLYPDTADAIGRAYAAYLGQHDIRGAVAVGVRSGEMPDALAAAADLLVDGTEGVLELLRSL